MSYVLFFDGFKLQESRPLALHTCQTEGKFQCMLYNIDVLSLEIISKIINFYNHNLVMLSFSVLSSTFRDRLKRYLSVANEISMTSCGNKQC